VFVTRVIADQEMPFAIKAPNAASRVAITQASDIFQNRRARSDSADALIHDIEENGGKSARRSAGGQRLYENVSEGLAALSLRIAGKFPAFFIFATQSAIRSPKLRSARQNAVPTPELDVETRNSTPVRFGNVRN
jgi:hypothetical protein